MNYFARVVFSGLLLFLVAATATGQEQRNAAQRQETSQTAQRQVQQAPPQAQQQLSSNRIAPAADDAKPLPEGVKVQRMDFSKAVFRETKAWKNLQVVFVEAPGGSNADYMSLAEALEKGLVKVEETGDVQSLTIENLSSEARVFVQAGDIVKGGRQDRTLQSDMILPPKSGKLPLPSFCVEHSRWSKRGGEKDDSFGANKSALSTRAQKGAACFSKSQNDVWNGVSSLQTKLNENVSKLAGKDVDVRSSASATSLELTMDNPELKKIVAEYLSGIGEPPASATGFLYAINGEFCGGELYCSSKLFSAQWPKLSKSLAVEAIAEFGRFEKGMALLPDGAAKVMAQFSGEKPKDSFVEPATVVSQFVRASLFRMDGYDLLEKTAAFWAHASIVDSPSGESSDRTLAFNNAAPRPRLFPDDPLWSTVIDSIEVEDVPVSKVLEEIQKKALAKLPAGSKLELKYVKRQGAGNETEPTVTMVVEDIPLGEAVNYTSRATNLRMTVNGASVQLSERAPGEE